VEELGKKLMNPYVVTLEVLALLLTAALIGAVTAAQGVRMPNEEDSPE
jgi:NADH:ubiquinone oxidoreductase subunit 6 (subunit J)